MLVKMLILQSKGTLFTLYFRFISIFNLEALTLT